jgi:hypothetical protein
VVRRVVQPGIDRPRSDLRCRRGHPSLVLAAIRRCCRRSESPGTPAVANMNRTRRHRIEHPSGLTFRHRHGATCLAAAVQPSPSWPVRRHRLDRLPRLGEPGRAAYLRQPRWPPSGLRRGRPALSEASETPSGCQAHGRSMPRTMTATESSSSADPSERQPLTASPSRPAGPRRRRPAPSTAAGSAAAWRPRAWRLARR